MRIFVKVKTKAREEKVEMLDENNFIVSVKEAPIKGLANNAVVKLLAKYFSISNSSVVIKAGHTSRSKIISIKLEIPRSDEM